MKVNDILAFGGESSTTISYARVTTVGTSDINVTGITTVSGVAVGQLPTAIGTKNPKSLSDLKILKSEYTTSTDNTLYTTAPKKFIADFDLPLATITIRKSFDVNIAHATNSLTSEVTAGSNEK